MNVIVCLKHYNLEQIKSYMLKALFSNTPMNIKNT